MRLRFATGEYLTTLSFNVSQVELTIDTSLTWSSIYSDSCESYKPLEFIPVRFLISISQILALWLSFRKKTKFGFTPLVSIEAPKIKTVELRGLFLFHSRESVSVVVLPKFGWSKSGANETYGDRNIRYYS